MRLIGLAVALAISLTLAPLAAEAQQAGRVARVGYLSNIAPPSTEELMKGIAANPFWTAMRELGWMEGQNMVVERRWGPGDRITDARSTRPTTERSPSDALK